MESSQTYNWAKFSENMNEIYILIKNSQNECRFIYEKINKLPELQNNPIMTKLIAAIHKNNDVLFFNNDYTTIKPTHVNNYNSLSTQELVELFLIASTMLNDNLNTMINEINYKYHIYEKNQYLDNRDRDNIISIIDHFILKIEIIQHMICSKFNSVMGILDAYLSSYQDIQYFISTNLIKKILNNTDKLIEFKNKFQKLFIGLLNSLIAKFKPNNKIQQTIEQNTFAAEKVKLLQGHLGYLVQIKLSQDDVNDYEATKFSIHNQINTTQQNIL
jgi:hypothetical protein